MDTQERNSTARTRLFLFVLCAGSSLAIGTSLVANAAPAATTHARHIAAGPRARHAARGASHWLKINRKTRHVVVTVIAGFNGSSQGFNFDGYSKGKADFVVPLNWKVQFNFSNHGQAPHSLALARSHGSNPVLAKIGGKPVEIANATHGITKGTTVHLSFVAKPAGRYFLICGVPGHDSFGMWDYFTINKHAKQPSIQVR